MGASGDRSVRFANSEWAQPFQRRLELVEVILVNKFPQLSFEEVLQMLDLKEVNLSETRFYQDVLQKGLEQGLEQVLQGGEAVGVSLRR